MQKSSNRPIRLGYQLASSGLIQDNTLIEQINQASEPALSIDQPLLSLAEQILFQKSSNPFVFTILPLFQHESVASTAACLSVALYTCSGEPTLIIDLSHERSSVSSAFNLTSDKSLEDFLKTPSKEEFIKTTLIPNLDLLSFDTINSNSQAIGQTRPLKDAIDKLSKKYSQIIILTPKITSPTSHNLFLLSKAAILLAQKGKSSASQIQDLSQACERHDTKVLGTILGEI